jgi:hypothetical protein
MHQRLGQSSALAGTPRPGAPLLNPSGAAAAAEEEAVRLSDLREDEVALIQVLAARFSNGEFYSDLTSMLQQTNMDDHRCIPALRTLAAANLISDVLDSESEPFSHFEIMPAIVSASREIDSARKEALAPKDIVEQVTSAFRRRPWTAWPIVIVLGLTVVFTFVNQIIQFLKNIGLVKP